MKPEEKTAKKYFDTLGFQNIEYEPDGNIPPDFLIDGSIAIEVRRLNQHHEIHTNPKPLENLEYRINPIVESIAKSFQSEDFSNSCFFAVRYSRPLEINNNLKRDIKKIFQEHLENLRLRKIYKVRENLEIELFPISNKLDNIYNMGIISDQDAGGFIVGLIHENLKLVIEEKEGKINRHRDKYPIWWLALVDTIGFGISELDLSQLNTLPTIETYFQKVILINPIEPKKSIEINK
jgi:hypothetical protein